MLEWSVAMLAIRATNERWPNKDRRFSSFIGVEDFMR